jgi:hypothetical protein
MLRMVVTTLPFGATKEGGDVIRVTLRIGPLTSLAWCHHDSRIIRNQDLGAEKLRDYADKTQTPAR